jgi:ABC-type dipeptide/oligopeptide/nickel transport system permease subunit
MIPRLIPMLIPQFIVLIPSFVFLEASLAVLGLGDPTLPTWGKMIDESQTNGALYPGLVLLGSGAFGAVDAHRAGVLGGGLCDGPGL